MTLGIVLPGKNMAEVDKAVKFNIHDKLIRWDGCFGGHSSKYGLYSSVFREHDFGHVLPYSYLFFIRVLNFDVS